MAVADVVEALRHGREIIRGVEEEYYAPLNETDTRYAIIDPIIRGLGWETNDPAQCRFEAWRGVRKRGRPVDYAMYSPYNELLIMIEAKSLASHLETGSAEGKRHQKQLSD